MPAGLILAGMSAVIGGMLVAAQGPICARLSEELNRDSLAAVFLAFLIATVAARLVVRLGSWRSIRTRPDLDASRSTITLGRSD